MSAMKRCGSRHHQYSTSSWMGVGRKCQEINRERTKRYGIGVCAMSAKEEELVVLTADAKRNGG